MKYLHTLPVYSTLEELVECGMLEYLKGVLLSCVITANKGFAEKLTDEQTVQLLTLLEEYRQYGEEHGIDMRTINIWAIAHIKKNLK